MNLAENGLNSQKRLQFWLANIAFWVFIAIMFTAQTAFSAISRGDQINWSNVLSWSVLRWLLWAAVTPLVFFLARRFPINRNKLAVGIGIQCGLGILVSVLHMLLEAVTVFAIWRLVGETVAPTARIRSLIAYSFHVNLIVYGAILGVAAAFNYYRKFKDREVAAARLETQLSTARLQALKGQLQPHFLFNTHHAIIGLILKHENETAMEMLTRLSDLLRLTLESKDALTTSLQREMETLNLYLAIQKLRFKDRLRVNLDIDPQSLDAEVPNMILQPLVENAILHGIGPDSSAGLLAITSKTTNGFVALTIRDDGPGLAVSPDGDLRQGIGLTNTRERLHAMYGSAFKFEVTNAKGRGVQVQVEFPYQPKREIEED